jgi:hypothetical protein
MIRAALLLALLVPTLADAAGKARRPKQDEAIPYEGQDDVADDRRRELPDRSEATPRLREETEVEKDDREISLASLDDPNIGLSGEVVAGLFLLESTRGQGVEPLAMGGVRLTWEWARTVLDDELWREVFFLDVTWFASSLFGPGSMTGTQAIYANVNYHYFTLAQGFAIPLGKTPLTFYLQPGIGLGYQTSTSYVQGTETSIAATRLVAQYGVGLRARIPLGAEGKVRLSFRIEGTRFRRGYMDDTLIGGSLGLTF